MRKPGAIKGKKTTLKNENKFVIRRLSMTERLKIKSSKYRNQLLKGQKSKSPI